jgi:hypothetical protein
MDVQNRFDRKRTDIRKGVWTQVPAVEAERAVLAHLHAASVESMYSIHEYQKTWGRDAVELHVRD